MLNTMIDDATLNDLQITGYPKMIVTDEVLMSLKRRNNYVAFQQKAEEERKGS